MTAKVGYDKFQTSENPWLAGAVLERGGDGLFIRGERRQHHGGRRLGARHAAGTECDRAVLRCEKRVRGTLRPELREHR